MASVHGIEARTSGVPPHGAGAPLPHHIIFGLSSVALMLLWPTIITTQHALAAVLLAEALLIAYLVLTRTWVNELLLLFVAISLFYSHAFLVEQTLGWADPDLLMVVGSLTNIGLRLAEDGPKMVIATVLFRHGVILGFGGLAYRPSNLPRSLLSAGAPQLFATASCAVASYAVFIPTGISLFSVMGAHLSIATLVLVSLYLAKRTNFRLSSLIAIAGCVSVVLYLITRSRLPAMVVCMCLLIVYLARPKAKLIEAFTIGIVAVTIFLVFGYFREDVSDRGELRGRSMFAQEEVGNIHLVGAHVLGMVDRGGLPPIFDDTIIAKIRRSLPGTRSADMLADRYISFFFPAIADAGGGFAFPIVGEAYAYGGRACVFFAALMLGALGGSLLPRVFHYYPSIVLIIIVAQSMRQELAVTARTLVAMLVALLALKFVGDLIGRGHVQIRSPRRLVNKGRMPGTGSKPQ